MARWHTGRSLVTRMVVAFCLGGLTLSALLGVLEYRDAETRTSASVGQQVLVSIRNMQDVLHQMLHDGELDGVQPVLAIFSQDPRIVAIRFTDEAGFSATSGAWPGNLTEAAVWTVDDRGVTGFGRLDLNRQTVLALPFLHAQHRCLIEAVIDGPYLERDVRREALKRVASQWLMLAVLTLVGLLLLRRWFTGPLMRLVRLASTNADADQFEQAGDEMGGEFRELADAVSRMLSRLDEMTEQLRGRERAFQDLYQSAPSALLSIDGAGRVTNANRRAAEIFGVADATALHGRSVLDHVDTRDRALFRQSVDRLAIDHVCQSELKLVLDDGRTLDAAAVFTGVYNDDDKLDRVRLALSDISQSKQLLRDVTAHKQLIDLVVNHMSDAIVLVSPEQVVLTANRRVGELLNTPVESLVGQPVEPVELWAPLAVIDQELFATRLRYATDHPRQPHQEQFDGRNGSYQFRIVPVHDPAGEPLAQLWVVQDVTAEVRSRRMLDQQDSQLRALQQMGRTLHSVTSVDELLASTTAQLGELMGIEAAGVAIRYRDTALRSRQVMNTGGPSCPLGLGGRIAETVRAELMPQVLARSDTSHWPELSKAGEWAAPFSQLGMETLASTALQSHEKTQGIIWIARRGGEPIERYHIFLLEALAPMLSTALQNAELRDQMRELELTDPVTGLSSFRRYSSEVNRVSRRGGVWSMLLVDMDDFKAINDEHGVEAADDALRHVAGVIRGSSRESDAVLRYTEDKFIVISPGATPEAAAGLAERIRSRVAEREFTHDTGAVVNPTCSIGLACSADDGGDPNVLRDVAQQRLRRAKAMGRNRIETADPAQHRPTA